MACVEGIRDGRRIRLPVYLSAAAGSHPVLATTQGSENCVLDGDAQSEHLLSEIVGVAPCVPTPTVLLTLKPLLTQIFLGAVTRGFAT